MQEYTAKITEIIQETKFVKLIRISFPELKKITFLPGQFVMIGHKNLKNDAGINIERAFSIASAPHQKNHLELCIKLVEGGKFSDLCKNFKIGEQLTVKGPFGKFLLPEHPSGNLIFFAGGTGIAPIMSMLRHLQKGRFSQKTILFFTFREPTDYIYQKELEELDKNYAQFTLLPTCTGQKSADWSGIKGRFTSVYIKEHVANPASQLYLVCGNNDFAKDIKAYLVELGVPKDHIKTEAWG